MKFNCDAISDYFDKRHEAAKKWHRIFALWPRRVGPCDCRWMEYVERKGYWECGYDGPDWEWEYGAIKR